jgi:predicted O-methyltransferase YrrM
MEGNMSNIAHDYIEDYIRGLIPKRQGHIGVMEEYAGTHGVPIVHPEVAQYLKILIKTNKVKSILEVGTAIGFSASVMAEAAGEGAKVVSIERDEEMHQRAMENIKIAGLESRITLIKGDAMEELERLEGSFDMIFLDAAKGHYDHFLPRCMDLLKDGGLLISDNVLFRGMVATNELLIRRKITIVKRMRKYLEHISNMPELETVVLPIGDGIAMSIKTGK